MADNTVAWSILNSVYRLPTDANHDSLWIVDVPNTGVTPTNFTKVLTKWPATDSPYKVEYEVKANGGMWVRITFASVGLLFDVGGTSGTELIKVTYQVPTGQTISTFVMSALSMASSTWSMTNSWVVTFTGTGFTPSVNYALKRNGLLLQCLTSTSTGGLSASIPASVLATYDLIRGGC